MDKAELEKRIETLECSHPKQNRILRTEGPQSDGAGVRYYVWEYCSKCSSTLGTFYIEQGTIPENWKVNTTRR